MKYALILSILFIQLSQSSTAQAWAEASSIQTYATKYAELTILGQKFETSRVRRLYSIRGYSSIWFADSGPNSRLQAYMKFIRSEKVSATNSSLLNVIDDLRSRMSDQVWVSVELLATESMLMYLNTRGVATYASLNKALSGNAEDLVYYLKNLQLRQAAIPKAKIVEPGPPKARVVSLNGVGNSAEIQKYTTSADSIKISGGLIYTDQLRKLYALRNYRSIWFENGEKSDLISSLLSFVKYQENNGTDVKEFWLPLTANASANYAHDPSKWVTIELLASHVLITFLSARNVNEFSELNKSIDTGSSAFLYFIRNLRNPGGVVLKALPVEDPQEGPILRAIPVEPLTDILMPAAAFGTSNSRFANDPSAADVAKFNGLITQPLWTDSAGRPSALANVLRDILRSSNRHGLNPDDYWGLGMEQVYANAVNGQGQGFEQYARYALLRYVNHIYGGRLDSQLIDPVLFKFEKRKFADYKTLITMLSSSDVNLKSSLDSLAPAIPQYKQLMRNLALLQTLKVNNAWIKIAQPKRELRIGESSPIVTNVRLQLANLGYAKTGNSELYDDSFDLLTKDYLKSNGIPPKIDYRFWNSISKSVDERIEQVAVNLEKLRWIPRVYRDRFAFINTAAQEIHLMENGQSVMKFRTINGKSERPTPSMLQQSKRVILNPTWTVPLRIAAVDKVPLIRANPNYLREHNMYVLDANTRQYIDYDYLNTEDLLRGLSEDPSLNKYYIVQGPGNLNALGVLKFPLQDMNGNLNSSDIFMHDTNERLLFENAVRYNSSGCIRLQYPLEFAAELLKGKGWTVDDIKARVPWNDPSAYVSLENTQQSVSLDKPLLVYIMYMTVDQNDNGSVRLFEDHYGLDAKIVEALRASH